MKPLKRRCRLCLKHNRHPMTQLSLSWHGAFCPDVDTVLQTALGSHDLGWIFYLPGFSDSPGEDEMRAGPAAESLCSPSGAGKMASPWLIK